MKLLVVEDSQRLARTLRSGLKRAGHAVDVVAEGAQGLSYARLNPYDVIVLDLMLPVMDGMTVLETLRSEEHDTPVLILTARDAVADRVTGLRAGADDYLVKPFSFDELLARLEALVRRRAGRVRPTIEVADLLIDVSSRVAFRGSRRLALTAREFAILLFLAERRDQIVSRIEIEDHVYGEDNFPMSNAVPSAICNLRSRLTIDGEAGLIHTRRGLGYVLSESAS